MKNFLKLTDKHVFLKRFVRWWVQTSALVCFSSVALFTLNDLFASGNNPVNMHWAQQNVQLLEVKIGELFSVTFPNPGAGGYIVQNPEFDANLLAILKMEKESAVGSPRDGEFGRLKWTFKAKKHGKTALIIRAKRPWEKGKVPLIIYEGVVYVKK